MRDFYVYVHRRKTDGKVFYVGKGCGNRASSKIRNEMWHRIVSKYGYYSEIVISGLQEWAAYEIESDLIAFYGRRNLGLGELANLTDGGDGTHGTVVGVEARKKRLEIMLAWHSIPDNREKHRAAVKIAFAKDAYKLVKSESMKRSHNTPEYIQKISLAVKVARSRPEVKARYRAANLGANNPAAKRVLCVENGMLFGSASEAKQWLRANGMRGCVVSAANGKCGTAGGLHWRYEP